MRTENSLSSACRQTPTISSTQHTDGQFSITLPKRPNPPLLLAEAEGYLPAASSPIPSGQTKYDFTLKRGRGPEGALLLPDGQPAAEISVFFFGPGEQFGLFANGQIRAFGSRTPPAQTDPSGRFSFPPRLENGKIFAASEAGFAEVSTEQLTSESKVALQRWGRIRGTLVQSGKPVANETLSVTFASPFSPDLPRCNLQHRAVTDAQGRFEFDRVPSGELQIVTLVPIDQSGLARGWTHDPQQTVTVKPGETMTVEIEKKEAPARGFPFAVPRKSAAKP